MSISLDKAMGLHAAALKLRGERHQVLSQNLANADTPNYKARDFDFQAALRAAEGSQRGGQLQMATTHGNHLRAQAGGNASMELLYRQPYSPSLDGNTVESNVEQAQFAENAVGYQASLNFLGDRITGLIGAIRGE
ncbi:flagellar basal-body rod protein FlgB [Natronocella acetinitrilica]|uniref:Flagellar basal body rod protein FlgB n=1 Tax=Natronocella acetinitrilica TaxID=414046 RepID=A0AAE3G4R5_9GAMM|nr:flagellar basal body rod protein FlgB [Natronocella acetinitrilica]MCP1675624.1 flagellar basal-body rod protein FlgB [Natronocella acetinitrilica]